MCRKAPGSFLHIVYKRERPLYAHAPCKQTLPGLNNSFANLQGGGDSKNKKNKY